MANTHIQKQVEEWIRQEWMPKHHHQDFSEKDVSLCSGGTFTFDAVSTDGRIVANISTGGLKTSSGKYGPGKVHKIRSDVFFLLLVKAERTLMLLMEQDMYNWWVAEAQKGRVPVRVEFVHVEIPLWLNEKLRVSRWKAAREVTPDRK